MGIYCVNPSLGLYVTQEVPCGVYYTYSCSCMCTCTQSLQQEQEQEISRLERQLEEMRFRHEDRIRGLKTQFLRDKRAFEEATEDRIRAEAQRANKVAH